LSFQEDGWKRVDRECAWQRFATGASQSAQVNKTVSFK